MSSTIKQKLAKSSQKSVYFIGIGGIGMSALARYFLAQNWAVSGSDAVGGEITAELEKAGIKVKIGHKSPNLPKKVDLVVYTAAILPENPELAQARQLGIKTQTYAEALGELTRQYKTIAVSGTHGKSTTTAMVASILIKAGFDPTVILGTKFSLLKVES